jgi:ATP-binding cassette subfamily B protein
MQEKKRIFQFPILKRLFVFTSAYRRLLWFAVIMSVVLATLSPIRPYLIQLSVDKYIRHHWLEGLLMISLIHFVLLAIESGLRFWFLYKINWLGQTVVNNIRKSIFSKILSQNIRYYDTTAIGTLTTRTINDMEAINDVFSEGIISIVADILTIVAIIVMMLITDWRLTLIVLTTFPALIIATYFFKESVNKSFHSVRNAVAALNAFAQEHITGMYLVQSFAAETRELDSFKHINRAHRDANIRAIFAYSVFFPVVEIILAVSLGLLVWWGAVRMLHYQVTAGVVIAFVMYLNLLFRPLRMLADKFNVLQMGLVAAERVFAVFDNEDVQVNNGTLKKEVMTGAISFNDVYFSYKEDIPVLRGVSFSIQPGQTFAIVGHTGAGKTSLISILNRMYEIQDGKILIDGTDISDYDIEHLRSHIGIVLQDVFLFSGTIHENISLRNENVSREKVVEVCKVLGLHEFIMSLPSGYDFNVMERGNTLSQGQRQLLSFARALVYNPSILILDEATSSVDSESEQLIQKAIDTMIKDRTSIIIAHRLSTIRKADEILVMEQGKIIEQGNHESLLALQGKYYELYLSGEKEEII